MLVAGPSLEIPLREFEFTFSRSSGPGGQNVNKVNTKVMLRWGILSSPSIPRGVLERFCEKYPRRITKGGDVTVTSQRFRDQGRNVADCLEKLRAMLTEVAAPPKARKKKRLSKAQKEQRLRAKREKSKKKRLRRPVQLDD